MRLVSRRRLACTAASLALALAGEGCARRCCQRFSPQPSSPNEVVQEFPAGGAMQTAWRVRWAQAPSKGLYITGAWFRRSPASAWMRVLWDARVAELFVPYHGGYPRYYDLTSFQFPLVDATPADAGCCGVLLGRPPKVVKELRDYGPLWKDDMAVRRGQELILWGTLDAANYNYIIQYGFRDDGTIAFRIGATARNLPGMEEVAHMHNALWRVDLDLNGFPGDAGLLVRHLEPVGADPKVAHDTVTPFNGGKEGSAAWSDQQFTQVRVQDPGLVNAQGRPAAYDLIPLRQGTSRHEEAFTKADFWVTRYKATEMFYAQLPTYVNGESITGADVVLWHGTPVHHLPRSEDGAEVNGLWKGVALLMWGGFDLRPRDLFDTTPLHP
jgi:primary-amine oxidase